MIDENKDLEVEGAVGGCDYNERELDVRDEELYFYNCEFSDEEFIDYLGCEDDQDDNYDDEDNDDVYHYRNRISMLMKRH